MNREEIIRMAREAGANPSYSPEKWDIWEIQDTDLERFADLVAAQEREAASERAWKALINKGADWSVRQMVSDAIRARGEK